MKKLALTLATLFCVTTPSQQQATLPVYDIVVIKPNNTGDRSTRINDDDASFRAINVPFKMLLVVAYGIREGQISGIHGPIESTRYDVTAKVTDPDLKLMSTLSRQQRADMVAAALVSAFHLQSHIEYKTLPVYDLVVAKGGSKLTPSAPLPPGVTPATSGRMNVNNTDMTASNITLEDLAGNLSAPLDRTVIDKTNLPGRYDFHLRWTPDNAAENAPPDAPPVLFTAIEEQLGLKLVPAKGPVKTLVIDHVEQPSGN